MNSTRMKLVPLAAAAVMAGLSASALAAPITYGNLTSGQITLDAEYRMPIGGALVDGMTDSSTSISNTGGGADMYLYKDDGNGNNVFFHTYGDSGSNSNPTYFGARASGQGSFYASTFARYSRTFTNNTLFDQIYNFSFNVSDGELDITGSGVGFASLMLQVNKTVNGNTTTLARDFTAKSQNAQNQLTCDDSSLDVGSLGSYSSCATTFFGGGGYNVSMGTIAAGDSFTLDYDIIATVSGDLTTQNTGYGYGSEMCFNGLLRIT